MKVRDAQCAIVTCAILVACGGTPKFVPPERTVYFPIPAESSTNSPLTYVVKANSAVDYSAPFVKGKSVPQTPNADISEVLVATDALRIAGGIDQVRMAAGDESVTHIIVDARVDKVFVIRDVKYNERSKCCEEGEPTDSCTGGYIESVLVGTGTVTYARLRNAQDAPAADQDPGQLRKSLDKVKARSFTDSFFAFTVASAKRACEFSQ